jgi:trehalose/maltose hydrolase-like predicted phosphorylase
MDLDDISKTTAGGLHLATMGGAWQAFSQGFLGVTPSATTLHVDPKVPQSWGTITHRCLFHSRLVTIEASSERLRITTEAPSNSLEPVPVAVAGNEPVTSRVIHAEHRLGVWELS